MPHLKGQKVYTIEAVIDAQHSHSEDAVLEIRNEDCAMSSPDCTPSDILPTEMAGANASGSGTCSDSKATTPTTSSSPNPDEPAPSTLSSATTGSPSEKEVPAASEPTAPSAAKPRIWSEQQPVPISLANWNDRVNIDTSTLRPDVSIFSNTKQTMREETSKMIVLASRGFERAGFAPTKKTSPPLRTRRYSIDVLIKPRALKEGRQWETDAPCKAPTVVQKYHESEPRLRAEPIQAFPVPLRYIELNRRRKHAPPYDGETYLAMGDSVLPNTDFNYMLDCGGGEAWMRDSALAMSLDVLQHFQECHKYGISIINPNAAQIIYLAARCDDADEASYDIYRDRLQDKRWIVLPINDGIGAYSDGTHWSLVIVDRVHKKGFYYDSTGVSPHNPIQRLACEVSKGLLMILGEDLSNWSFLPQEESPNQWCDNQSNNDRGPCGPFVWKMAQILIDRIIGYQLAGNEAYCDLSLHRDFPRYFKSLFDSWHVRLEMQHLITLYKYHQESFTSIEDHDQVAVQGEEVVVSQEHPAVYLDPERPASEGSNDTPSEDERDQDPSVSLKILRGGGISLVGEDDSTDDLSLDVSSTMCDDSPPKDLNIDDWDMMDSASSGSGFRGKVHHGVEESGPPSRKRHAEPVTTGRPRPRTPPEQNVDVDATDGPLPGARERSNSVKSYWSDVSG